MSTSKLILNLVEGSISFDFTTEAARNLQSAIAELMQQLKSAAAKTAIGSSSKPTPQKPTEYLYTGLVITLT